MRYRLDDIAAFLAVVDAGSISTAATQLNLSKSVVSKRVADLERALGVELLHRSTRGVTPTDEGVAFHARGRSILQQLDEAAEAVSTIDGELSGSLRISVPMSFGTLYLGPILCTFLQRHPRLDAAIDLDDRVVDVQGSGYDLAIRIAELPDSSLIAKRLATSRRVVCCSPNYAARAGLPRVIEDIAAHACIGYANVASSHVWRFEPAKPGGEIRALTVRCGITTNNGETIRDAAIAGLGLAVLPTFIVTEALADGQLIEALPGVRPTADPIYAVYPRARHRSKKIKALLEHLQSALGGEPPWERALRVRRAETLVSPVAD
ncbi:MAG TPA: LysR family transcriptional regulator [Gammaproteobacteria bacterium]|nr:LysR family transcriptional regulator [Gammaproteobacteria bacterium]